MRKNWVKTVATAVALLLLAAGCGGQAQTKPAADQTKPGTPAAPAEEKRLTLYTSFGADLYNPIAEAFKKETGIEVDVVYAGTGEILKRIDAEKAAPQGDVMLGGGAESFEAYRPAFEAYKIKEDDAIPANLKAADRLWYANNALPLVIAYNKNLVKETEKPSGWKDLTDPKWKGKIAMANAAKSGTSFLQVTTMLTIFGRDDGKGWDVVKGIVKNAKVLDSSTQVIKGTNDGEYSVSLTYEHGAWKYLKAGGPVGLVYPAEGTGTMIDSVAVIKGAKHPQNARTFMDWLLGKQGQAVTAQLGLRPARADVASPEGLPAIDKIKRVDVDQNWAVAKRNDILTTWQEILTK